MQYVDKKISIRPPPFQLEQHAINFFLVVINPFLPPSPSSSSSWSPSRSAFSERPLLADCSFDMVASLRSTRMAAISLKSRSTLARCSAEVSRKKSKPLFSANFCPMASGISRSLSHLLPTRTRSTEEDVPPVAVLLLPIAATQSKSKQTK